MAGKRLTITEIAQAHRISRNHLTKVVMTLAEPPPECHLSRSNEDLICQPTNSF